jgi:hypothetical protein
VKRIALYDIYTYKEGIMKPTKHFARQVWREREEWKYNGVDKLVPSTLYMCMEFSQ